MSGGLQESLSYPGLQESQSFPLTEATSGESWNQGYYSLEESSSVLGPKKLYEFLDLKELGDAQREALQQAMSCLAVDEDAALRLLRKFSWHFSRATEKWFADPEGVQRDLGLIGPCATSSGQDCPVCFSTNRLVDAPCGHGLCSSCWQGVFRAAVEQGPSCLSIRCPIPDCSHYIPRAFISQHARTEDVEKFNKYWVRSYVDDNPQASWCPGAECGRAAVCKENLHSTEMMDLYCDCGTVSCFRCHDEGHRPVDCDLVGKWRVKNNNESDSQLYILAYTKPCPACKVSIEKNQGCMHMSCSQCGHQFCWLCCGPWEEHGDATGGYYQCNRFEEQADEADNEEEQRRKNAKNAIERYTHYFERWSSHGLSHQKAIEDIAKTSTELDKVMAAFANSAMGACDDLSYVIKAWEQVVECRRILKYSYVYGFFNFEDPNTKNKKAFFEFIQGDAENSLERLHDKVEDLTGKLNLEKMKEIGYLRNRQEQQKDPEEQSFADEMAPTRKELIRLTDVTGKFFMKLVDQLEKGIDRLGSKELTIQEPPEMAEEEMDEVQAMEATRRADAERGFWICNVCTFGNTNLELEECEICQSARGAPPVQEQVDETGGENENQEQQAQQDGDQQADHQGDVQEEQAAGDPDPQAAMQEGVGQTWDAEEQQAQEPMQQDEHDNEEQQGQN